MSFYKFPGVVRCVSVEDLPDGRAKVVFEASEEFKEGFKKYYNLKKWSQKKFNKFLEEAIHNMAKMSNEDNDQKKEENKY